MKKLIQDFKKFAFRGNILDMAVGIMIGGAISQIVSSLVNDIIMPLIGLITGGIDLTGLSFTVGEAAINYGQFLTYILDFLIMAFCIFLVLKLMVKLHISKEEKAPEKPYLCPHCQTEVSKKATRCPHCTSELVPAEEAA